MRNPFSNWCWRLWVGAMFFALFAACGGGGGGGAPNQNCADGMVYNSDTQSCVVRVTQAICNDNSQILVGLLCHTCSGDTPIYNANTCESTKAICNNKNMILESGACRSCRGNKPFFNVNTNTCQPSQAVCNDNRQILVNGACQSCDAGTEQVRNDCQVTRVACNDAGMMFDGSACQACSGSTPNLNVGTNTCQPSQAVCNDNSQILVNGACQSCDAGTEQIGNDCQVTRVACNDAGMMFDGSACQACSGSTPNLNVGTNTCQPSQAICHANRQILVNGACQSCDAGTEQVGNVCQVTRVACNAAGMVLPPGAIACQACSGNTPRRSGNNCLPPDDAFCNAQKMVLVGGACQACSSSTPIFNDITNTCQPSQEICNGKGQILQNGECISCGGNLPRRDVNVCLPPDADFCNAKDMILPPGASTCQSCSGATPIRDNNNCIATKSSCNAQDMALRNGVCVPCTAANSCNRILAAPNASNGVNYENNSEYTNAGRGYGKQNIGAHYAYQRGYWGQGVTVGVIDSELDVNHVDLSSNIVAVYDPINDTMTVTTSSSHGTAVAGIIGAARNSKLVHGVAPSVKIVGMVGLPNNGRSMGNSIGGSWRFVQTSNISMVIVNNSYGGVYQVVGDYKGTEYFVRMPSLGRFFFSSDSRLLRFGAQNIVMVWAAGNERWHVGGTISLCDTTNLTIDKSIPSCSNFNTRVPIQDFIDDFVAKSFTRDGWTAQTTNISNLKATDSSYYMYTPHTYTTLRDKWLGVVATDSSNRIAFYSNGCGDSKYWCLAAPGTAIRHIINNNNNTTRTGNGTSFAAPHVSGALAILKSRFPSMPMEVIRAILLTTATDLGNTGIDDIYGWGLVNLQRAITLQGDVLLPFGAAGAPSALGSTSFTGVRLADAQIVLPESFAHIQTQLSSISLAVSVVGNAYYNADLSQLVRPQFQPKRRTFGNAALEILNTPTAKRMSNGAWFADSDIHGKVRRAGAVADLSEVGLGAWQLQHDFCDDCQDSVWRELHNNGAEVNHSAWNETPFFARGNGAFVLSQNGEGLRPFISRSGKLDGNNATEYEQAGLRWQQQFRADNMTINIAASASRINEKNSLWGADFGDLVSSGQTNMRTRQGRLEVRGALGNAWRGFAAIEEARGAGYQSGGGILGGITGLRARGWSGGFERRSIFSGGDSLRLSARRETGIIRGRAVIHHQRAEGSFSDAFYGSIPNAPDSLKGGQQLINETAVIDLRGGGRDSYALGYALGERRRLGGWVSRFAVGLEYDSHGKTAASAQWHVDF